MTKPRPRRYVGQMMKHLVLATLLGNIIAGLVGGSVDLGTGADAHVYLDDHVSFAAADHPTPQSDSRMTKRRRRKV